MRVLLIVLIIIVILLVICLTLGLLALKNDLVCPKCGTHFKVKPLRIIFSFHMFFAREVTCSNCEHRTFMKVFQGKK